LGPSAAADAPACGTRASLPGSRQSWIALHGGFRMGGGESRVRVGSPDAPCSAP